MKRSSKILLGISFAGLLAFLVKSIVDKKNFAAYHVTFDFNLAVNALLFLFLAVVLAAVAMFKERKKRELVILAAVFGAISAAVFIQQMVNGSAITDSLLIAMPYFLSFAFSTMFAVMLAVKNEKRLSVALLCGSGVSVLFFIVACVVDSFSAGVYDNVMQRVTGYIMYGLFYLLPAAIMAAAALYFRRNTVLLAVGAAVCAAIIALMLILRVLWIMTLPALITAAVCVVLSVLAYKKRGMK